MNFARTLLNKSFSVDDTIDENYVDEDPILSVVPPEAQLIAEDTDPGPAPSNLINQRNARRRPLPTEIPKHTQSVL